jgi:hypothetical protein
MPLLFRTDGIQIIIAPLNILGKQNVHALGISAIALSVENATAENFKISKLYTEGHKSLTFRVRIYWNSSTVL